jgi:hypothetical protein
MYAATRTSAPDRPVIRRSPFATLIALGVLLPIAIAPQLGAQENEPTVVHVPAAEDIGYSALERLKAAQMETKSRFRVPVDFAFTDRQPESGITFRNIITDDNRKSMKASHYDHGNGIAVADVDGDGLLDVYFTTQVGENELWKNLSGDRFENVTEAAGVGVGDRISIGATFADVDNDGDQDLFVSTVRQGNLLFVNDGKGGFRDVAPDAGLAHVGHSSGAMFLDYDNDGLLDLFVTNVGIYTHDTIGPDGQYVAMVDAFSGHLFPERTEISRLYRNLGDLRFEDVSEAVGIADAGWSGDASFTDLNGDGYPDVYVLNMQGDDHYYESVGGEDGSRRFVERAAELFPRTPWGAMGIKFFDYDNNGLLDLILTDMHSDMSREIGPDEEHLKSVMMWSEDHLQDGSNNIFGNAFYENLGDGEFREISDPIGAENYWPWGLSVADLNADGWQDLFISSGMSFPFRYGINSLLLNNRGGGFLDSEFILGVEPRRDGRYRIPWFELDCSGPESEHRDCQGQSGNIVVTGTLGTRSSVVFDLDDDGDLDIVTNEFFDVPQVLVSDLSEGRELRFLKVRLIGKKSNRDGLGAWVRLYAGDDVYTRYHDGKSGYLSQSASLPLYFGLGDHAAIDKVEVTWPAGGTQTVSEGLQLNSLLEIVEP